MKIVYYGTTPEEFREALNEIGKHQAQKDKEVVNFRIEIDEIPPVEIKPEVKKDANR